MRIKIETFLIKRGNKLANAAVEFGRDDGILAGLSLTGFTICVDDNDELFVLFPNIPIERKDGEKRVFFLLKPTDGNMDLIDGLEEKVLEAFENYENKQQSKQKSSEEKQKAD
jgi:hypothetical protein